MNADGCFRLSSEVTVDGSTSTSVVMGFQEVSENGDRFWKVERFHSSSQECTNGLTDHMVCVARQLLPERLPGANFAQRVAVVGDSHEDLRRLQQRGGEGPNRQKDR